MDFNIVTLEIADLIVHFDYYDSLVSDALSKTAGLYEEQNKIRFKSKEHLAEFFTGADFYTRKNQLLPLAGMKDAITAKLKGMKAKDIHELVEKLEKDAKKMKKLYKSLTKKP
jgi:hypothetical protein